MWSKSTNHGTICITCNRSVDTSPTKHGCTNPGHIKYYTKRVDYKSKWRNNNTYKISDEELIILRQNQNYICPICKQPLLLSEEVVDHCHNSLKVRGLLHRKCNILLGMADDNIDILTNAIEYLKSN